MRQEVIRLLQSDIVEPRLISLLKTLKLVDPESTTLHGIVLTDTANIQLENDLIEDTQLDRLIQIFPKGDRINRGSIRKKMSRFMISNPEYGIEDILNAADYWIRTQPYHGQAQYFFYKKENGEEFSRCLETLQELSAKSDIENVI